MGRWILLYLILASQTGLTEVDAAKEGSRKWAAWVEKQRGDLLPEFAEPTAKDLTKLSGGKFIFLNSDGKGSVEFSLRENVTSLARFAWDGGEKVTWKLGHHARVAGLIRDEESGSFKIPLLKIKEGVAVDGFRPAEDNVLVMFAYDSRRQGLAETRQFKVFEYDPAYVTVAEFVAAKKPKDVTIVRTRGEPKHWKKIGTLKFSLRGQGEAPKSYEALTVYQDNPASSSLFFMFRDQTSGASTYAGGRFLDVDLGKKVSELKNGDSVTLDFNFAFNPMCARSPAFMCPVPEDRLTSQILAGEKKFRDKGP